MAETISIPQSSQTILERKAHSTGRTPGLKVTFIAIKHTNACKVVAYVQTQLNYEKLFTDREMKSFATFFVLHSIGR